MYCFLTVTLRANQNVTGLAMTTFGVGFGNFFGGTLIASGAGLRSVSLQGSPKGVYLIKVGKGQTIKLLKK